jgi:hypothetical protein
MSKRDYILICSSEIYPSSNVPITSSLQLNNNANSNSDYSTLINVYRENKEGYTPVKSYYKFTLFLRRNTYPIKYYPRNWLFKRPVLDGVAVGSAADVTWPELTNPGVKYLELYPNTLYELYSYEIELNNDGKTHRVIMHADCIAGTKCYNMAQVTFKTTTQRITPGTPDGLAYHILYPDTDKMFLEWRATTDAVKYEIRYVHYDAHGDLVSPDTQPTNDIAYEAFHTFNIARLRPEEYYLVYVRAISSTGHAGDWSIPQRIKKIYGARVKIGDSFIEAIPYVKHNNTWQIAMPYVRQDGTWYNTQ